MYAFPTVLPPVHKWLYPLYQTPEVQSSVSSRMVTSLFTETNSNSWLSGAIKTTCSWTAEMTVEFRKNPSTHHNEQHSVSRGVLHVPGLYTVTWYESYRTPPSTPHWTEEVPPSAITKSLQLVHPPNRTKEGFNGLWGLLRGLLVHPCPALPCPRSRTCTLPGSGSRLRD